MQIVPAGPPFLVAAITLGLTEEDPFLRHGLRPVRIELKDPDLASRPLGPDSADVRVAVDRGVVGYVYSLPERSPDEFLNDSFGGCGAARCWSTSPAGSNMSRSAGASGSNPASSAWSSACDAGRT